MALTDNRTLLNDCEDDANGFATSGAQLGFTILAGQFIEGAASIETQHSNVYDDTYTNADSADAAFDIDLSDQTVYMAIKDNLFDEVAVAGAMIVLGDGTDRIGYTVGGRDAVGMPYANQYAIFKLDGSDAAANPGTEDVDHSLFAGVEANLAFANITIVGFGTLHGSKAQGAIPNVFIDNIRYIANDSFAASITAGTVGTPETMADVVGDDETVGAGMFANPFGSQFIIFAPTEWGDDGASDSYFEGIDEQWYLMGDNSGSRSVGLTHFPMAVVGNGGSTNSFELTRVVIVNTGQRAQLDLSDTTVNILNLSGVTFDGLDTITFPTNSVTKDMADLIFNDCGQVFFDDVDVDGATFNGTTNALGAILWNSNDLGANQINITLNSDATGHGVQIDLTGDGPGGGGEFDFSVTGWEVTGYETSSDGSTGNTVFIVDNDNDNDVTINVVDGLGSFSYERAAGYTGTVTVNQAATVIFQGMTEGSSVKLIANETVGSVTVGDTLFEGRADADGKITYVHNFEGDIDIKVRARNQGIAVAAIADDGGALTDETDEANDVTADDVNLLPATPVADDQYYIGHTEQFTRVKVDVTDVNGSGSTITWQYWNGAWVALSGVVDGTNNFETTGESVVSWDAPGDWATSTENSQGPFFYVRARLTTLGSANQTRARKITVDATRYLPFPQSGDAIRTITSTGLTETVPWVVDSIAKFESTD